MGRKAGLTTEAIIDTAAAIADREGLENLTLAGLAIELGVQSPSLYNHVAGLDGVRRELALRGAYLMTVASQEAREGLVGEDALRSQCFAFRDWARAHPGLYAATVPGARLADDDEVWAQMQSLMLVLVDVLGEMGVAQDDVIDLIRALRATLHGFVALELANGFGRPENIDQSYGVLVEVMLSGMNAHRQRPPG